jgi:hypothetical protein
MRGNALWLACSMAVLASCGGNEIVSPRAEETQAGTYRPPHPDDNAATPPKPGAFGLTAPFKPRDPQQGSSVGDDPNVPAKGTADAPGTNSSSTGE